jgi:hypothetical protein
LRAKSSHARVDPAAKKEKEEEKKEKKEKKEEKEKEKKETWVNVSKNQSSVSNLNSQRKLHARVDAAAKQRRKEVEELIDIRIRSQASSQTER